MKQMKKRLCGILVLVMCILFMIGCAANPDRGSVTSKNDGIFEQNMTVAATAPLDEEILYTDTFTSHDGTVEYTINLDQELNSDPLPIVEVVPHFFTGEDVKRVAHALFGDVEFYEREHEEDAEYSKEQLQKRINWMTELATPEALRELYGDEEYVADTLDRLKHFIQYYTVQMEAAPEENPHTPCEWTFKEDKNYASSYNAQGDDWIVATVDLGDVNYKVFAVSRNANDYKFNEISVQFGDGLGDAQAELNYLRAKLCRTPEPTQEQIDTVKKKAQNMLDQMEIGEWKISFTNVLEEHYGDAVEYQIQICATPVFQGVHALYGQQTKSLTSSFTSNYHISTAVFHFSANGDLIYFDLDAPVEIKSVVNEGVAILPTEELLERTKEYLTLYGVDAQYLAFFPMEWYQKPLSCKVSVDRLEFGLARVRVANSDNTFYYTPAFAVYGSASYYDRETGEYVHMPPNFPDVEIERPLVWINAVDGSIIEEA